MRKLKKIQIIENGAKINKILKIQRCSKLGIAMLFDNECNQIERKKILQVANVGFQPLGKVHEFNFNDYFKKSVRSLIKFARE